MNYAHDAELCSFIEAEIDLGLSFAQISSTIRAADGKQRAISKALTAFDTATVFMGHLSPDKIPAEWCARLTELRAILDTLSPTPCKQHQD